MGEREFMSGRSLHSYSTPQPNTAFNRAHMLFHSIAVVALLYYRLSRLHHLFFFSPSSSSDDTPLLLLSWGLMTFSELLLSLLWFLQQPFRWRPVVREVHLENLPGGDGVLPAVDVFIVTADPEKEPTVDVMNTVVSAMALDYPPEKLAVYLSDDGGVPLTLFAMREVGSFAKSWVPFCRKYKIKAICPQAYFSKIADDERLLRSTDAEFNADHNQIESLYELFKKNVENAREEGVIKNSVVQDRPPCTEVIHDNKLESHNSDDQTKLPLLVYVSRERRPAYPHHYKGGALNALLRVSGLMSKAPYMLVLDCDMFCNEPASARQAMCFHLDSKMSHVAFVQYPQIFHNIGKEDIYDAQGRTTYKSNWHGMDGLRGPILTGTGYYMKKEALFGTPNRKGSMEEILHEPEKTSGVSSKVVDSNVMLEKARISTSCTFEQSSNWGKEIGFSYASLLESSFTGYLLHCRGWTSVYYYPKRAAFLGCAPTDLKNAASQLLKWISGLLQVGLSRLNPITYGRSSMSVLQSMCYGYFMYITLYCIALLLYSTVPQLCFFRAVPLYPKVSDPWFGVFAITLGSSLFEQINEVLTTGGSMKVWWFEFRIWMVQSVTGLLFGALDALTTLAGLKKATLSLSNKAIDEEKMERYNKGKFDFQGAGKFIVPLSILIMLNLVCFIVGVKRMIVEMHFDDMFGQLLLLSFIMFVSYTMIEGLVTMKR